MLIYFSQTDSFLEIWQGTYDIFSAVMCVDIIIEYLQVFKSYVLIFINVVINLCFVISIASTNSNKLC